MNNNNIVIEPKPGSLWTAAHTKPRCEKVVDEYCSSHGITRYLPLRRTARRYQRRTVDFFLPMFPGYIFVQVDEDDRSLLLQSHRVVNILRIQPIAEKGLIEELNSLKCMEAMASAEQIEIRPDLAEGVPIIISNGPMQGMRGIIEHRNNGIRIIVNIEILGRSVSVTVDSGDLDVEA